jgi:hypothetical protein|tara:strand:- start:161 stop:646 length:486 start_codon:yes stop_codon:yes gene_type:complete
MSVNNEEEEVVEISPRTGKPKKKHKGSPLLYKGMPPLNPKGRPKGSVGKYTQLSRELMSERGPDIVNKVIELAMEGDTTCLKMCLDRILPPKRDVEVKHEGGHSINIMVEQIGSQAQDAIEHVGGAVIEHDLQKSIKASQKATNEAYDAISVSVLEEDDDT